MLHPKTQILTYLVLESDQRTPKATIIYFIIDPLNFLSNLLLASSDN